MSRLSVPLLMIWIGQTSFMMAVSWQFGSYIDFMKDYTSSNQGIIFVNTPDGEKARYDLDNKCVLQRPLVGNVPVYAFTSMWIAIP